MTAPEIQQEIDRTNERLNQTMEELTAKADMRARTRDRAGEMKVKAQGRATEVSGLMKDKATDVSGRMKRSQVMQRRWPIAAAAGVVIAGSVAIWRRRKH
jgi:hypothetical protein